MDSYSKNSISGDLPSKKRNGKNDVSSAAPTNLPFAPMSPSAVVTKPSAASGVSPAKRNGKNTVSSAAQTNLSFAPTNPSAAVTKPSAASGMSPAKGVSGDCSFQKHNAKVVVSSDVPADKNKDVLLFKNLKLGPQEDVVRFRLIHFWEARNALSKTLIGLEMLLIDEEGTVIQGYIPASRLDTYLRHMIPGSTYTLTNFFGSKSKQVYWVADPDVTISFSWNSVLSVLKDSTIWFPEDRFRFHEYEQFEAACDLKGDLYDYIGHIKLVNEQTLNEGVVLDEAEIASKRRILVHVQSRDGPVIKLYIWDKAANTFCEKFKALGKPPSVILVTTVNPKRFGGALSLSSFSSSRVFFDVDVHPTREYLAWLETNSEVANRVNANIVTKAETATIGELLSYMKQEGSKVAWFECVATIDDVVRDTAWYYIACGGCKTKATKGPTTFMCKKCGETEINAAAEYLSRLSVYDNVDRATFVVLGDAGRELTGKKASELVESYYEANESTGGDQVVPVPRALIDTIGQTRTFVIKVSQHNLEGKTQALTVTKVLPLDVPVLGSGLNGDIVVSPAADTLETGNHVVGSSNVDEQNADEGFKRRSDTIVPEETKRAKCG